MKTIKLLHSRLKTFVLLAFLIVSQQHSTAQVISGGDFHSLFVCKSGATKTCGNNEYGQLGDGTTIDNTIPIQVSGLSNIIAVAGGLGHSLFLKNDGTVWACGENGSGQLGDGTTVDKPTPIQVSGLSDIIAVAGGALHSLFLKDDGTVWACGENQSGQLGDGTSTDKSTPIQVSGLSDVMAATGGSGHSLFLKNDGTVWACGWNLYGQLGDGTTITKTTPIQVSGLSGIKAVAGGGHFSLFLKTDGTVWACGRNSDGQLGDGTTINKLTPIQVNGLFGVKAVAGGGWCSLFLKNDGTVWACGGNAYGQLGDGTTITKTTPIQVSGLSGITAVAGGENHSIFLKNDGTVWACGWNTYGQLGLGTTNDKATPIQVSNLCFVSLKEKVSGYVYNDINSNCIMDLESGLGNRFAIINPGNILVQTDGSGYWYLDSLPAGNYTIIVDTIGNWLPTCSATQPFSVLNTNIITHAPDFGLISTNPCAEPEVSLHMPFIRRGFSDQKIYVKACNGYSATGALNAAYTDMELDILLTVDTASIAYTELGNSIFRFQHGDLNPGQCASFWISTTVSLDAVLEQTLCMEASLYPADSCVFDTIPSEPADGISVCTLPWDKSSIKVEGWCENDSLYFTITNTGDLGEGDMQCYSPMRLYIDGKYILLDSVLLLGGEVDTLVFSGDGRTWRLEVDQHPLHPGNSHPNATVELCGNTANWTARLVDILPMNDADPVVDIYCGIVRASYDPNDKTGYPLGVDEEHKILPNGELQYVIRFQNTGTDTAFTIVVRDTLDIDFNIFSVKSGVSSHNYDFTMYGPRVLQWTFNNILLPDSSTNQEGSNGFVTFTVKQNPNLPDGTELNNNVGIYFDFNEPVITNTTSHLIDRGINTKKWEEEKLIALDGCESVSYNGIVYANTGSYMQIINGGINPDTLLHINATIKNNYSTTHISNCEPHLWTDGNTYTETGTYSQMLTNVSGCDSIATLELIILESTSSTNSISSCESFIWSDGNAYSESGTFSQLLTNAVGCDSVATLELVILESTASTTSISECESFIWTDGNTYTESGSYSQLLTNGAGCDSVANLELVILENTSSITLVSECENFVWTDGNIYTETGIYSQFLTNTLGCDSIATLQLTILSSSSLNTISACESYTWTDGNTYDESGTYSQLLTNAVGCDSTANLVLTVGLDTSITVNGSTLSSNVVADSYQWLNCANNFAAVNGANAASFVPSGTGIYALSLEANSCADTSSCYYVYINSSNELEDSYSLKAIPNPTSGKINLISNVSLNGAQVMVFNSLGEKVLVDKILNSTPEIDLSALSSGVYFIQVKQENEERYLRIVKE